MSGAVPLTVERWGWRAADSDMAVVALRARWAGQAPSGRVALVAEREGHMTAFVLIPEARAASEPFHAGLRLPLVQLEDARTGFRLRVEDGPAIRLDRPAREEPEAGRKGGDRSEGQPSAERRLRDLERDLERERAGREAMEGALQSADETSRALSRVRSEGEELRSRLATLERARAGLEEELAAARAAAREREESVRAREAELAAGRLEAAAMGQRLDAATREIGVLRESLAAEADARAGADGALRTARKERDAAIERERALQERGQQTDARGNALERALREAREQARSDRAGLERVERDLDEARSRAAELARCVERARSVGEERIPSLKGVEAELGQLAATARELATAARDQSPPVLSPPGDPDGPGIDLDGVRRAVTRGRDEAAALEGRVRDMRSALLELAS